MSRLYEYLYFKIEHAFDWLGSITPKNGFLHSIPHDPLLTFQGCVSRPASNIGQKLAGAKLQADLGRRSSDFVCIGNNSIQWNFMNPMNPLEIRSQRI